MYVPDQIVKEFIFNELLEIVLLACVKSDLNTTGAQIHVSFQAPPLPMKANESDGLTTWKRKEEKKITPTNDTLSQDKII